VLTMRHVAAALEKDASRVSNEPIPVVFALELRRRGKPILDPTLLTPGEEDVVAAIRSAKKLLAGGISPGYSFLRWLGGSLQRSHSKHSDWFGPPMPPGLAIRLGLEFRDQNNRPPDPSLGIRRRAVRWHVDQIASGLPWRADQIATGMSWRDQIAKPMSKTKAIEIAARELKMGVKAVHLDYYFFVRSI
jgi:hypothetical protein